jgi:hypothetical protein
VGTADDLALPFGSQVVGSTTMHSFRITNQGDGTLTIDSLQIAGDNAFNLNTTSATGDGSDDIHILSGQSQTFTVSYTPAIHAGDSAQVKIGSNDPDQSSVSLQLSGFGGYPNAVIAELDGSNNGQFDAGDVRAAFLSSVAVAHIANTGDAPLHVTLALANGGAFGLTGGPQLTIAPGQGQDVSLNLSPQNATTFADTLTIASDDLASASSDLHLSGRGYMQVDSHNKFSFDSGGVPVTVAYKGAGSARVFLNDAQSLIDELDLIGTDITSSTKIGGAIGLHDVASDGALKSFKASDADVTDAELVFGGPVGKLSLHSATRSFIHAPDFLKISFMADVIDSSIEAEPAQDGLVHGIAKVKITGSYLGSIINAGIDPDAVAAALTNPENGSGGIGVIGSISIGAVQTDNGGQRFGIVANEAITSVKVGSARIDLPFVSEDFVVAVLA